METSKANDPVVRVTLMTLIDLGYQFYIEYQGNKTIFTNITLDNEGHLNYIDNGNTKVYLVKLKNKRFTNS